jgi:TRAP-type transport system periplasmic protein
MNRDRNLRKHIRIVNRRTFLGALGSAGAASALTWATPLLAQATLTLRFASLYPPMHAASRTADKLAELVAAKTGGMVKIDVFHNSSLGSEREAAEGVRSGSIDLAYSGLTGFGSYVPEFGVIEMPYNFANFDQLKGIVDQVAERMEARMASQGLQLLGFLYDGPRVTLTNRPLNSLADFRGLKLRVPQIPLYLQMVQAFGAIPTPVALPEVYTALQSRIADGLEGTPTSLYSQKYHEVAKNLARTDHIFFVAYIAMNKALFDKMPKDQQDAMRVAGKEASTFNLEIAKPAVMQDFDRLVAAGVQVTTPDLAPFRTSVADLKEKYAAGLGQPGIDLYNAIKTART